MAIYLNGKDRSLPKLSRREGALASVAVDDGACRPRTTVGFARASRQKLHRSPLRQVVEEVSAHLEVNVAGDGRLVDMHHCSYLSHDKCSFFLEEFRLVKDLEDVVLFDHLLLLVFFLIFFYLLYKVSLSVLRGTQERYGLVVQVELV